MQIIEARQKKRPSGEIYIEVEAEIDGEKRLFAFDATKTASEIKKELQAVEKAVLKDKEIATASQEAEQIAKKVEQTIKKLNN